MKGGLVTFTVAWERGPLRGAVSPQGLALVALPGCDCDEPVAKLAAIHGAPRTDDRHLAAQELRAYLDGRLRAFSVPLDLGLAAPFARKVLVKLCDVPYGQLTTYGELAVRAGSPRAARAVGGAVGRNPIPIVIPCHRVVAGNGLGGFGGGLPMKRALLAIEGVDLGSPAT